MTATTATAVDQQQVFLNELIQHGHFLPYGGEPGLYGRGMIFEDVRARVDALISRLSESDRAEKPRFPPFIPKGVLERTGYLESFPQLCGVIFSFTGNEDEAVDLAEESAHGADWSAHLSATNIVAAPAACYPAYPAMALRGRLPRGGVTLDLGGCYVFRHEPSADPARLQVFHQREMVRIGNPGEVLAWREQWMARAISLFNDIAVDANLVPASDPFFGRGGKLLARNQKEQGMKFEIVVPVSSSTRPTAVSSFNFHQDHFGEAFGIALHDGSIANSACVGFGLERITLALFAAHGMDPGAWPTHVRSRLWPDLTTDATRE